MLRLLVKHWYERRGRNLVTRRTDIDIIRLAPLMPHLFLYDYDRDSRDLTLRLAGEEIRRLLPNSRPGTPLAQIMPAEYITVIRDRYRRVCEEPAIAVAAGRVFLRLGGSGTGERVLLPLADAEGRVHQMLGATLYELGVDAPESRQFAREEVTIHFFPLQMPSEAE